LAKSSCGFAIALARGVATVDGYALSGWKFPKIDGIFFLSRG